MNLEEFSDKRLVEEKLDLLEGESEIVSIDIISNI